MSKSYGNHIGITDPPADMYGKTLRIPDTELDSWYGLLLGARSRRGRRPARRQARPRARARDALLGRRTRRPRPRPASTSVFIAHELPDDIEEFVLAANGGTAAPARGDRRGSSGAPGRRRGASWPRAA